MFWTANPFSTQGSSTFSWVAVSVSEEVSLLKVWDGDEVGGVLAHRIHCVSGYQGVASNAIRSGSMVRTPSFPRWFRYSIRMTFIFCEGKAIKSLRFPVLYVSKP